MIRAISAKAAYNLDQSLFTKYGFKLEQLMELAGLCVAICADRTATKGDKILICAGPGNNGGDGLVAGRHLIHFGRRVDLFYPKRPVKYDALLTLAELSGVRVIDQIDDFGEYGQVVDAIFGFSFDPDGGIRAPFDTLLADLAKTKTPIMSVDVPSGWHVEKGPITPDSIMPAVNLSLSAPKPCIRHFTGVNYLGGRFLPPGIIDEYNLKLPLYPEQEQIVQFDGAHVQF